MARRHLLPTVVERLCVLALAGIPVGVVVGGIGSRLAMLLLRMTSGPQVHGIRSDDGFVIGRVTLGGSFNLLLLGATIGVIGAAAYLWVRPWLVGPEWCRDLTVALASGAVVGSLLVHADGVDFTLLTPTWLAVATFVALPALFGALTGPAVRAVERRTARRRRATPAWVLPAILVATFPLAALPLALSGVVLAGWTAAKGSEPLHRIARAPVTVLTARAAWLVLALAGLAALVDDVIEIYATT